MDNTKHNFERDVEGDLTIPNIPFAKEEIDSLPAARANNNYDLTEMQIRVFDVNDDKSVVALPLPRNEPGTVTPKSEPRRRVPVWIWAASAAAAVVLLLVCGVAVFLLLPRNSAFTLKVAEAPAGSKVFVDGIASGVPQADGTIVVHGLRAEETREVVVKHDDFDDWSTSIKGEAGKELLITAKLVAKKKVAAAATNEIDYTGSMVLVSAGAFVMGDNRHRPDEGPEHEVTLESYYIDKYEVTNEQYRKFCDETHHAYPPSPWWNPQYFDAQPQSPVVGVSWDDANAYAKWAGKRLPNEAEWEKAASWDPKTQQKRQWPWGNSAEQNRANLNQARTAVSLTSANENAAGASAYAVQNMSGNAAEWVDAYYQPYGDKTPANAEFGTKNRVVRGGTSVSSFEDARTTRRFSRAPDYTAEEKAANAYLIGFRCAVSANDPKLQEYLKGKTR